MSRGNSRPPPSSSVTRGHLLLDSEPKANTAIMDWVIQKNKIQPHNGESALFSHGLLSPRKDEQLSGQSSLQSLKPSKATMSMIGSEEVLYCRAERAHQYLQASMSETSVSELTDRRRSERAAHGDQLGRPTRSSLLRAKHQYLASFGSFQSLQPEPQWASDCSTRRCCEQSGELQQLSASLGETVHSFLVGARYNRSTLDSNAFKNYGLFISRKKPTVSFLIDCKTDHPKKHQEKLEEHSTASNTQPQNLQHENEESPSRAASSPVPSFENLPVQETDRRTRKSSICNNAASGAANPNGNVM